MSVYYDGKHSIDFFRLDGGERIGKNSWSDFHLIPVKKPIINPKQPASGMLGFPNTNRRIYQPKFLPEKQTYGLRSGEWEFYIDNESFKFAMTNSDLGAYELKKQLVDIMELTGRWVWNDFDFNWMTTTDGIRQYAEDSVLFLYNEIPVDDESAPPVIGRQNGQKLIDEGIVFQRTFKKTYLLCVVEEPGETGIKTLVENHYNIDFVKSEYSEADYYTGILNIPVDDESVWIIAYRELVSFFHGIKMAVRLNDYLDAGHWDKFYTGRIIVQDYSTDDKFTTITLHYDLESGVVDDISKLDLKYDVFWYDFDGELLRHDKVPIGTTPSYDDGDYDINPRPSSATKSQSYKVIDNTDGNLIERTYSVYENSEVTFIPNSAFYSYGSLTKASFPNCSFIGSDAFWGCTRLNLYLMSNAVANIANSYAIISINRLYVPNSLVNSYKTHSIWSFIASRIYSYSE
jgi:hypothetical protein